MSASLHSQGHLLHSHENGWTILPPLLPRSLLPSASSLCHTVLLPGAWGLCFTLYPVWNAFVYLFGDLLNLRENISSWRSGTTFPVCSWQSSLHLSLTVEIPSLWALDLGGKRRYFRRCDLNVCPVRWMYVTLSQVYLNSFEMNKTQVSLKAYFLHYKLGLFRSVLNKSPLKDALILVHWKPLSFSIWQGALHFEAFGIFPYLKPSGPQFPLWGSKESWQCFPLEH